MYASKGCTGTEIDYEHPCDYHPYQLYSIPLQPLCNVISDNKLEFDAIINITPVSTI